ncbi:hypothetical protein diail_6873 [Diaporthe ilicicola]|nr:hypothetical protein diail_6873 [Diaporthe ilicicola]
MGVLESKVRYGHQSTSQESETPLSKDTKPAVLQEIVDWEKIYKERFARKFIFSTHTCEPLSMPGRHTASKVPWEWRLDTDIPANRYNPRYIDPTPEPLSTELAERTRHELRQEYHEILLYSYLRGRLKALWLPESFHVPRVPYLTDEVIFPHASQIKNGHILPARVRSYISGEPEGTPRDRDAFSTERLKDWFFWPNSDDLSQLPDDNMLLSRCAWLNQTTAIYFEPKFEKRGPDNVQIRFIGRGLFAAWQMFDRERGEEPNLQQRRYFAHPVMLLGEAETRPIADIIATHRRMCDALADAQDKPVSPKDPYSWVEHGAEMGVVYPSIIIVVDEELPRWKGNSEADAREKMFEHWSVLLVRTGNEEHLSEPIDFSGLGDAVLPLGRDESLQDNQKVVRVRLDTAVRFVMSLERREQDRCPRLTAMKKILDEDTFRGANKFAADSLAMAEKNGSIDRNFDTWDAVRKARACLDGEPLYVHPQSVEWAKDPGYPELRFW